MQKKGKRPLTSVLGGGGEKRGTLCILKEKRGQVAGREKGIHVCLTPPTGRTGGAHSPSGEREKDFASLV